MPHHSIDWRHLRPRVIFVSLTCVLFALLSIYGDIEAFKSTGHHVYRGGAGFNLILPFIFFHVAYTVIKRNKVSNLGMVLALTGFGFAGSLATAVYVNSHWIIVGILVPYFLYTTNSFRLLYMEKKWVCEPIGLLGFCFLAFINFIAIGFNIWRCFQY